jgi:hypothetical protein
MVAAQPFLAIIFDGLANKIPHGFRPALIAACANQGVETLTEGFVDRDGDALQGGPP